MSVPAGAAGGCGVRQRSYSAGRGVLVACWLAVGARALLVLGLLALPLAWVRHEVWGYLYLAVVPVFVLIWGIYLAFALALRCPACGRRFLIESRDLKHPAARRARYCDYWGTVVSDVIRYGQFACMYCGATCRVGHWGRSARRTPVERMPRGPM